jgi:hypothetical protein
MGADVSPQIQSVPFFIFSGNNPYSTVIKDLKHFFPKAFGHLGPAFARAPLLESDIGVQESHPGAIRNKGFFSRAPVHSRRDKLNIFFLQTVNVNLNQLALGARPGVTLLVIGATRTRYQGKAQGNLVISDLWFYSVQSSFKHGFY